MNLLKTKKMALKKPTKPKYKAFPKTPKMSASKEVWTRYEKATDAIKKENMKKKSEYERALRQYENEMKSRERIKAKNRDAKTKLA